MSTPEIIIYCDGACSGNPGPGGWGSIVIVGDSVIELGGGDSGTTNNRMEMTAIIEALQYCATHNSILKMRVYTDSVYVIKGITQWIMGWKKRGWKNSANEEVSNQDLWIRLDRVVSKIKADYNMAIDWKFVKGHSGVPGNERCDEIAVAFSKNAYIDLYKGDANNYIFDVRILPAPLPLPEMKNKNNGTEEKKTTWYLSYVNGVLSRHETWKECEAVVKGRPAKFKKVTSISEENEVKKSWGIS